MISNGGVGRVQVTLLGAWVDPVAAEGAITRILYWCRTGAKQYVVTPNLDHCRLLRRNANLTLAYDQSGLVLPDGWPLIAASRVTDYPLPKRISGAGLVIPLCQAAARSGFSVFLLGSATDVLHDAADALKARAPGLKIAGFYAPPFGFERDGEELAKINRAISQARPDIVLVAFGAPKQELWMASNVPNLPIAAALGIGASLDFLAGRQRRAPGIVQTIGAQWLWRALSNPRRLSKRYLACVAFLAQAFLSHFKRHVLTKRDTIRKVQTAQPAAIA